MIHKNETLDRKIAYIIIAISATALFICCRLFYLQVFCWQELLDRSNRNFLRIESTPSLRGNIVTTDDVLLGTNRSVINLYWNGCGSYKLTADQLQLLQTLSQIFEKNYQSDETVMKNITYTERYHRTFLLASDISTHQLSKLKELIPEHANIAIETTFKRFYPFKSYASHILGYLTAYSSQTVGKMGLEQLVEESLRGKNGTKIKTINSFGRSIAQTELDPCTQGKTVRTTIQSDLQRIAESVFPENHSGACIVMDPQTGALRAIVSRPSFDPNIFLQPINTLTWAELQEKQPFLNRAFNACYPPGSIFKLVTISAALEHNVISAESVWNCRGYYTFANRRYWCHRHYGHGKLSTQKALAESCNILFYEIGRQINIDLLADYAHRFGLGKPTHIMFPEKIGTVPSKRWKLETKHERWWLGETLSAAIGQSFLLVSPLQIARMISAIFTQKLTAPRILVDEPIIQEPLLIAPSTLDFLKRSMKKVVKKGTGRTVSKVKDIEIYAKTSTAQTSDLAKRSLGTQYLEHGWFAGYCIYKDQEPFTLVILVEHAGASEVATSVAKQFLIEYKKFIHEKKMPEVHTTKLQAENN